MPKPSTPASTRIMDKVTRDTTTGCWIFTGARRYDGYGIICEGTRRTGIKFLRPHRVLYEATHGPIPDGHELHHTCHVRACCNPDHLQPLRRADHNMKRINDWNRAKTHCIRGHEFTEENTTRRDGSRHCKECARIRAKAQYARKKANPVRDQGWYVQEGS
jgi:hypothetical protein